MDKAPQRRCLTGEELHSAFWNFVPVTHIGVQKVSSTAHHITHTGLFNVLHRTERVGLKQTCSPNKVLNYHAILPAGCDRGRTGTPWPCAWWAEGGASAADRLWAHVQIPTTRGSGLPPAGSLPWSEPVSPAAKSAAGGHPGHAAVLWASHPRSHWSSRTALRCPAWWLSTSSPCWEYGSLAHSSKLGNSYKCRDDEIC